MHIQKHTDLPIQHLATTSTLSASLVIASFGSSEGYNSPVFDINLKHDPNATPATYEKPLRYGKRDIINHIFRGDPKSPPMIVSLVFGIAVLAAIPAVVIGVCDSYPSPYESLPAWLFFLELPP